MSRVTANTKEMQEAEVMKHLYSNTYFTQITKSISECIIQNLIKNETLCGALFILLCGIQSADSCLKHANRSELLF